MGNVSNRLIRMLSAARTQKVVNIEDLYAAQKKSEEDLKSIKTPDQFGSEVHPFHAVYASVQNLVSVLAENLSVLKEFDEYTRIADKALDTYVPGYPPMSPNTNSFFSFWAYFDLRFGIDKETMGSCIIDASEVLQMDQGTVELIRNLQASRMGIYRHQGVDADGYVLLEEVFIHKSVRSHSASGYQGIEGEIWFVRLAPPPFDMGDQYVTMTTPYVITGTNTDDWLQYFDRTLPRIGTSPPILAYEELMKFGLIPDYWNEYVFQAYSNYRDNVISLHGIPDKSESLPHFDPESTISINLSKVRTEKERRDIRKRSAKKVKRRK